jgi:hypothetical protein
MTGRGEVQRLQSKLDATFERAKTAIADIEVQSDLARHLCVLVSGFLEQAVIELTMEHTRRSASPRVQRHVERRLRRFTSANSERLLGLLATFDPEWRSSLFGYLVDERKAAVDSVIALRHRIAHGHSEPVTLGRVEGYYVQVKRVVTRIAELCVPTD